MADQNKCPSKQTRLSYINRAKGLIEKFEKGTGFEIDSETETFLHWLHIQASDLSPATRRMYRSAVRYYFEIRYKQNPLIFFPEFMRCTQVTRAQVRKEHGKRTSAQKSKLLFSDTYTELKIYLNQSASKYAQTIQDILLVSSTFGLRPIECAQIKKFKVNGDLIGMKIKNAKHTDGRSFGKYRTIWFQVVDEKSEEFEAIGASYRLTALFSNKSKIEAERWLKGARNFLNQLYAKNRELKKLARKNRITLYSGRHQFSANAKQAGVPAIEIAAMMGHGSDETHVKSYGKRRVGSGKFTIQADPLDVERVVEMMQVRHYGQSSHQLGR